MWISHQRCSHQMHNLPTQDAVLNHFARLPPQLKVVAAGFYWAATGRAAPMLPLSATSDTDCDLGESEQKDCMSAPCIGREDRIGLYSFMDCSAVITQSHSVKRRKAGTGAGDGWWPLIHTFLWPNWLGKNQQPNGRAVGHSLPQPWHVQVPHVTAVLAVTSNASGNGEAARLSESMSQWGVWFNLSSEAITLTS